MHADSLRERSPQPFLWKDSAADELTLTANPQDPGSKIITPILGDEGGILLASVSEMLASACETKPERNSSALAYRKGFTAGTLLLACYIFDSNRAPLHKSSKARGAQAAAQITGMKIRSVENFFLEFNSVAHLWASYLVCAEHKFLEASKCGLGEYTRNGIHSDFLDYVDLERLLSMADQLADYGLQKEKNAKSALIDGREAIRFPRPATIQYPISSTAALIEVFLMNYPPGKRDTRGK